VALTGAEHVIRIRVLAEREHDILKWCVFWWLAKVAENTFEALSAAYMIALLTMRHWYSE